MDLSPLIKPKNMAVIGVSLSNDRHPANVVFNKNNLRRKNLTVYAVNPKGGNLAGDTVYKSIGDIPEPVDLAVLAVRADLVPDVLTQCIEAKVGGAVIISGGFAEVGRADLQEKITEIAKAADFPFVGPNCLGVYTPDFADTFFLPIERMVRPDPGNVAVISQSGGILVDQLIRFLDESVGLHAGLSIGNKALIRELDLLEYFEADPEVEVIVFYVEGFSKDEGRRFVTAAQACEKPVVVIKSGKSEAGGRAVSSHTASLAGDYRVFSSIMAQHGILEARNDLELISYCEALSAYQCTVRGNVGIVTGSGGHGAMAVDACVERGLKVPTFGQDLKDQIKEALLPGVRDIASLNNPVDLTGSALDEDFAATAAILGESEDVDCLLLLLLPYLPGITSDLGARLAQISRKAGKPTIAYVPKQDKYRMLVEGFELNGVPVSSSIEGAVYMVESLRRCQPCSMWR